MTAPVRSRLHSLQLLKRRRRTEQPADVIQPIFIIYSLVTLPHNSPTPILHIIYYVYTFNPPLPFIECMCTVPYHHHHRLSVSLVSFVSLVCVRVYMSLYPDDLLVIILKQTKFNEGIKNSRTYNNRFE